MTVNLLKCPGLVSGFWPFSAMLSLLFFGSFPPALAVEFSLESLHVSWTFLNILGGLNHAVVYMFSARYATSASLKPLEIVSNTSITIGNIVAFNFDDILFSGKVQVVVSYLVFFHFPVVILWDNYIYYSAGSLLFIWWGWGNYHKLSLGFGGLFVSQNPREFCVPYSPGKSQVCAYTIS